MSAHDSVGIVEDARVLRLAREELVDQLGAVDAQRLGAAVDVEPVAGLVLHLGDEGHLPPQRGRAGDPVALGQHADDLGVGVLRHHAHELVAVLLRHPVLGLDRLAGVDAGVERGDRAPDRRPVGVGRVWVMRSTPGAHGPAVTAA